jgi:hypothetical protein
MPAFEYKVIDVSDLADPDRDLSELGRKEWEVAAFSGTTVIMNRHHHKHQDE